MAHRTVLTSLLLASLIGTADGTWARPEPAGQGRPQKRPADASLANRWVSMVVTKITQAGQAAETTAPGGFVTIRVRIGADGTMESAAIEDSSGSPALDERALRAVRTASPFSPPPERLLTLEGYTELSFPLEFEPSADR